MGISRIAPPAGIAVLAALLFGFLMWGGMWDERFLGKLASVVTITSLVVAPAAYFLKKLLDEVGESARASENLYVELDDATKGLDAVDNAACHMGVKLPDGGEIHFMNTLLNHDFYDSLVASGKINFLPPNMQQPVQDVFHKIKDHNSYIGKIREIEDSAAAGEHVFKKKARYYGLLAKIDKALPDAIYTVQKELGREFKIG